MIGRSSPPLDFRVLIVDDEELARASSELVVETLGLEPVIAIGETPDLLRRSAKDLAYDRRCHLALVDTQLRQGDRTDQSGISLISELKPAFCIIHSGSDDGRDRTDAAAMNRAHDLGPVDYVKKGDDLSSVIMKVLKEHWNWDLAYDLHKTNHTPKTIIEQLFPTALGIPSGDIPEDEVDSLLRRVFNKGTRYLELETLEEPPSNAPSLRRSVVLFCEARDENGVARRQEILKLAPEKDIEREKANYDQYVQPLLQHQFTALVIGHAVSWDMGIIRYTDETTGRRYRFTEWYADKQALQITRAIKHLYKNVLKPWYDLDSGEMRKSSGSIYEYYFDPSRFKRFSSYMSNFANQDNTVNIEPLTGLINPVLWAEENKGLSRFNTFWGTLVHGDLHSGNIIVDDDAHAYVIDYERTGPGFFLRDFVELEKDVRLRLLRLEDNDVMLALHLDLLLMKQRYPDKLPTWKDPALGTSTISEEKLHELRKAFAAICSIRRVAAQVAGLTNMKEYYWALLMETLISATNPRITGFAQERALLSASVICERFELWHRPEREWPPKVIRDVIRNESLTQKPHRDQSMAPVLKLQLTDLRNDQRQFKIAVLGIPDKQPYTNSALLYQDDGLIAVMKLLELGRYQPGKFSPPQVAALGQLGLLQDNTLARDWCDHIGHGLFEALLPTAGGARREFENAFYTDRKGGELQLVFDKDATDLACQPWELLRDGFPDEPRTPIDVVRYIASGRTAQTLEVPQGPCQILYVTTRPRGYPQAAHDRDVITASIASSTSQGRLEFKELSIRTHQSLKQRLMDTSQPPVHVLHFDGHGTFARLCPICGTPNYPHELICDADHGENKCGASLLTTPARGYLLFETAAGAVEFIDTTKFLEGIQRSEVRLVVLSSCHSARVRGADLLLAGVGPGLILAGVPAVVAMQFSISDKDAIQFNKEFYKALAQGDSLPNAAYRARTMLPEPARWSPVLYLRSRDHQIHLCPQK